MLSLTGKVHHSRTHDPGVTLAVEIDRLDFRNALVIEESTSLRGSIVQMLKKRGWIAHGISVAGQAFPLLKCIPYHLIVIDGNASSIAAINFARTLHNSEEWSKTPPCNYHRLTKRIPGFQSEGGRRSLSQKIGLALGLDQDSSGPRTPRTLAETSLCKLKT